jgi:hypothetical protein
MKKLTHTLIGITLMLTGFCSYGQSISTLPLKSLLSTARTQLEKPVNKDISAASVYGNDTLIKRVDEVEKNSSLKKAHTKDVEINDTETWGEWQVLGIADMTSRNSAHSDVNQAVTVYRRFSTVSGHEKIFQLKIPEILDGYDAIFLGEANDRQPYVTLKNEYIDYDHTYRGYSMVASGFMGISYYKAMGKILINYLWHFVNTNHNMGLPDEVAYTIQLRDMPEYSDNLSTRTTSDIEHYPATVDKAIINITRTDNIAEIRYKVTAMGYPGPDYSPSIPTVDYDNDEAVVVLGKNENTITVDIEGRQLYLLTYMCYTEDGIAIKSGTRYFWSMHEDGKQWKSLGNAKYADKDLQWHYVSGVGFSGYWDFQEEEFNNLKLVEWNVELQQCVDEPTLYRLVNPYANCPFIGQEINLMTYEQDDNGEYIGSVYATYTPQYDTTQNYYLYIYSDNDLQSNNNDVNTQRYSVSGFKYSNNGENLKDYFFANTYVFSESNYIEFYYAGSSIYAKLPGYIDYKFTADYDEDTDIITVTANDAENSHLRYQIIEINERFFTYETDLPESCKINLKNEGLTIGDTYNITITNYDSDVAVQASTTITFTYGFTEWESWNNVSCSTAFGTETATAYRRHEKSNPNHEQYKIEMGYGSLLIDAADVTNLINNRYTPVTVPAIETYNEYWMTDMFTHTGNESYKEVNNFDTITGKFTIYAVYSKNGDIAAQTYDTYIVDGYADLVITLGNKNLVDGKFEQEINVELKNCAYAKYGFYSSDGYDEDEVLSGLRNNSEAPRITETTTLKYSEVGTFYFVAVAFDVDGNEILNGSLSFTIKEPIDMTQWTKIGTSTVYEGWVLAAYNLTETQPQEAETYVRTDNDKIIGLYGMFSNDYYTNNIFDGQVDENMIIVDASDTDCIIIEPQYPGHNVGDYTINVTNVEGYYYNSGTTIEDIKGSLAENRKTYYDAENNAIVIPQSRFTVDGMNGLYNWTFSDGTNYTPTSYIYLPNGYSLGGVSDISIDNEAPSVFYNLNGVRVSSDNLVPGLYIRRQGEKVTKVIVK